MEKQTVYQLPKVNTNIFDSKVDVEESRRINFGKFKYGFLYYIHQTKDKMEITTKLKKKFHNILNLYEHKIDLKNKNEKDLDTITKQYLELKNKPPILSRAFYKLWELIIMFNLIDSSNNFVSAHLAEGPGSFIQSVIHYRQKFFNDKNDKYYGVTLQSNNNSIPIIEQKFIKHYKNFILHNNNKDNGDLTKLNTIHNFYNLINKSGKLANLVTADGGFVWKNENYQEQEVYKLLLGEIIAALWVQAEGGHFVLKIFESYTGITIKFMCILQSFYENVFVCKPYTSRESNSEKYLICTNFKLKKQSNTFKKYIMMLEKLLEQVNNVEDSNLYINDIFTSFKIPSSTETVVTKINQEITNKQVVLLNKMVTYIKNNNYYGNEYNHYRDKQLEATQRWVKMFYPDKNNLTKIKKENEDRIVNIIESNK